MKEHYNCSYLATRTTQMFLVLTRLTKRFKFIYMAGSLPIPDRVEISNNLISVCLWKFPHCKNKLFLSGTEHGGSNVKMFASRDSLLDSTNIKKTQLNEKKRFVPIAVFSRTATLCNSLFNLLKTRVSRFQ